MRSMKVFTPLVLAFLAIGWAWGSLAPEQDALEPVSPAEFEMGAKVYEKHCKSCHLEKGRSRIRRLNLSDDKWKHGASLEEIAKVITDGVESSQMQPFKSKLTPQEIQAVAKYVKTLGETKPTTAP